MLFPADFWRDLILFHEKAVRATYAGGGGAAQAQRPGFIELAHEAGEWSYRDSYTGFLRSWGQEVVARAGKGVWTNVYGGGMEPDFMGDADFARQTFAFLKASLSAEAQSGVFRPRGPEHFVRDDWCYRCSWQGDVSSFCGDEAISQGATIVFRHRFAGGAIVNGA